MVSEAAGTLNLPQLQQSVYPLLQNAKDPFLILSAAQLIFFRNKNREPVFYLRNDLPFPFSVSKRLYGGAFLLSCSCQVKR